MTEQLEAAIDANPDDVDAYLVYADWLLSRGDPRGELIVMQHQNNPDAAQRYDDFLGRFVDFANKGVRNRSHRKQALELEWRLGFIRSARIGWETSGGKTKAQAIEDLRDFLELPSCRFLQTLTIGPVPADDFQSFHPFLEALAELARPQTLRTLVAGNIGHWDISGTSTGPFTRVLAAFPKLRALTAHAGEIDVGTIDHDELREARFETGGLGRAIDEISVARWPKLEHLDIWFGTPRYGGNTDVADVRAILAGTTLPSLRHLGLMNAVFTDDIVRELIGSPILEQIRSLDLSMGTLSDAGARLMAEAKHAFAHLERLDVDDNAMTPAAEPLLAGLAANVVFGTHDPDRIEEADYEERYSSVSE